MCDVQTGLHHGTCLAHLLLPGDDDSQLLATAPTLSRGDFKRQCIALAANLDARRPKQVALWFDDAVLLGVALIACWRSGITAILLGDARPGTLDALDAPTTLWLTDVELSMPHERTITLSDTPDHRIARTEKTDMRVQSSDRRLDLDAGTLILQTSGSSGPPKHIAKSWRQLDAEVQALCSQWPHSGSAMTVLGSVSPQHMYGLLFRLLWPLATANLIDRTQRVFPEALVRESMLHARCRWITSPALLRRFTPAPGWQALAPRLSSVFSSGGPLPANVSRSFAHATRCSTTEIYGSSETGAIAWREDDAHWQPLPGAAVGVDEDALLWVRSQWATRLGTQSTAPTADAATVNADGRFRLMGRQDRIVKVEEKRVSLPRVEALLAEHLAVEECHIGQALGQARLSVLVSLTALGKHRLRNGGRQALVRVLREHLAQHCEPLAIPRYWRFFRQLPYNAQGKLTQADFQAAIDVRSTMPEVLAEQVNLGIGGDASLHARLAVPLNLDCFGGHFPDAPILPGVVQISWADTLGRILHDGTRHCRRVDALKFKQILRPGDELELQLNWEAAKSRLLFEYSLPTGSASSGRLLYEHHD